MIAANRMGDLLQAIDRLEPKNAALYYNTARPFARLAGRNQSYAPHYSLYSLLLLFYSYSSMLLTVSSAFYISRSRLRIAPEIFNQLIVITSLNMLIYKTC